jgi:long-chain acyl-CoA synthetase
MNTAKPARSKKNETVAIPDEDLTTLFRQVIDSNKTKTAVFFKGKFKTYGELDEEVNRLSNSLKKLGIKKGDRIAVFLPNCPQFVTTFFAVQAVGGIFTAFNPLYSAREIQQRLEDCKPKILVTLNIFLDKIKKIEDNIPVDYVIVTSVARELPIVKKYLYKLITTGKNISLEKSVSYNELLAQGENKRIKTRINPREDVAVLQYTGGTTGDPKGAMLTHRNLIYQSVVLQFWKQKLKKQPEGQNKVAGVLPFSHIFGLTSSFLWPISEGLAIYLVPDPRKLEEIMTLIDKYHIHFLYCVPVFFQKFAMHKNLKAYDLSSLHLCISGGESLPKETVDIFEKNTGCLLIEGYGLSEASPVTHVNYPNRDERRIGSIGVAIPNTSSRIVNTDTKKEIRSSGKSGELWVKGPGIMKGYWNNPSATKNAFYKDWLRTGDIAIKNEEGFFTVVDRLKDMIIVSGFKVWPNEVEEILLSHPSILEAAVIGVPSDLGTRLKAILVKKDGKEQLPLDEIKSYCKQFLASYKVPKLVEYRDELPRSSVGKILRRQLRNEVLNA